MFTVSKCRVYQDRTDHAKYQVHGSSASGSWFMNAKLQGTRKVSRRHRHANRTCTHTIKSKHTSKEQSNNLKAKQSTKHAVISTYQTTKEKVDPDAPQGAQRPSTTRASPHSTTMKQPTQHAQANNCLQMSSTPRHASGRRQPSN